MNGGVGYRSHLPAWYLQEYEPKSYAGRTAALASVDAFCRYAFPRYRELMVKFRREDGCMIVFKISKLAQVKIMCFLRRFLSCRALLAGLFHKGPLAILRQKV